ncbi:hypothetical protein ACJX0J_036400, partial [Zea mays]
PFILAISCQTNFIFSSNVILQFSLFNTSKKSHILDERHEKQHIFYKASIESLINYKKNKKRKIIVAYRIKQDSISHAQNVIHCAQYIFFFLLLFIDQKKMMMED